MRKQTSKQKILNALETKSMKPKDVAIATKLNIKTVYACLLYTSPSPRDRTRSRMPSSA